MSACPRERASHIDALLRERGATEEQIAQRRREPLRAGALTDLKRGREAQDREESCETEIET